VSHNNIIELSNISFTIYASNTAESFMLGLGDDVVLLHSGQSEGRDLR
jgi:hypothetical protein